MPIGATVLVWVSSTPTTKHLLHWLKVNSSRGRNDVMWTLITISFSKFFPRIQFNRRGEFGFGLNQCHVPISLLHVRRSHAGAFVDQIFQGNMFEPIGWGMWEGSPYANDYNLKEDVVSASQSEGVPSSKYLPGGHTTPTCGKNSMDLNHKTFSNNLECTELH